MARSSKPVLLFAISGIASAAATFMLLAWGARPAADIDGYVNGRSGPSSAVDGDDGSDGAMTGASSVSTTSAAATDEMTTLAQMFALDPAAALRSAAEISAPDERRHAVLWVGKQWAWTDPQAALAMASTLPSILRVDYLASVSREWANLDADGFLDFAERATDLEELVGGLELLIPSEPFRVWDLAIPRANGENYFSLVAINAVDAMAEQDAMLALQAVESGAGAMADGFRPSVLVALGRKDPDAAIAWLESFDSPSARVKEAVFRGIVQADFERGYRLLTEEVSGLSLESPFASSDVAFAVARDAASAARVAETLLEIGTDRAGQVLEGVARIWAQRDPEGLVDWMIANASAIEPQVARSIGIGIVTSDLDSALSLIDRMPSTIGNTWVPQIAGTYASRDPLAAFDWVERYRGQAIYEEARAQAVLEAAARDPELVASMLPRLPAALQASAVPNIAAAWVERDPRAAAQWVAGLDGSAVEAGVARDVARDWVRTDLDAARRWALGLPRGRTRDYALLGLIGATYSVTLEVRPLFDQIESADLRRYAAQQAAANSWERQPEVARAYLDLLLDDEEMGEWARGLLDRMAERN